MKKFFVAIAIFLLLPLLAAAAAPVTEIDLLWEADTYTPPFYRGHSQTTPKSTVLVVAVPDFRTAGGKRLKTEELKFEWVKDLKVISTASGLGKNILRFTAEGSGANQITVAVSWPKGELKVEKSLTVAITAPKLVLFEDDPLTGITYHRAVSQELNLAKPEITLVAEPFFFDQAAVGAKKIDYDWRLNGRKIVSQPMDQRLATFAVPEGGQGENIIEVLAKNTGNVLQSARRRLIIKFNQLGFDF